jgi:hypothetical protein
MSPVGPDFGSRRKTEPSSGDETVLRGSTDQTKEAAQPFGERPKSREETPKKGGARRRTAEMDRMGRIIHLRLSRAESR